MTMNEDIRYTIALSRILVLYPAVAQLLYREFGSAQAVYENRNRLTETVPDCSQRLIELLQDWSEPLLRADEEIRYMTENNIEAIPFGSDNYPTRLRECADTPLLLYYRGNANLNARRVISIVGTRHCTVYGNDLIRRFVADLKTNAPIHLSSAVWHTVWMCALISTPLTTGYLPLESLLMDSTRSTHLPIVALPSK